jgi:hypothetical protein
VKIAKSVLLLPFAALTVGCATLFSSSSVPVTMQSDSPGAEVWIGGALRGKTPLTLELDNTKPVTVTFKQQGRQDHTVEIPTKVRAGMVVLDVLGGLIPVVIDASTGEWKTLEQRTLNVNLLPAGR